MKDSKKKLVNRIDKYARGPSPTLLYKPDEIELINDAFDKLDNYVNERENKALASEPIENVTKDPGHNQSQKEMYKSGPSDFHSRYMVRQAEEGLKRGGKRKSRRKRKLKKRKTMKKKRLKRKKTMKKRKSRKRRKTKKRSKRR